MSDQPVCRVCGREFPAEAQVCPGCGAQFGVPFRDEPLLLLSLVGLVLLFVITGIVASRYHARQRELGAQWYDRGSRELQAGDAGRAIRDLHNALVYSRGNPTYELRLSEALAADNRLDEAQAYLKSLWEEQPSSGPVNLALARVAARRGSVPDALRYYHNAAYADWGAGDTGEKSRTARLELYRFLVAHKQDSLAQAELIEMSATLPADPGPHLEMGHLFLDAGQQKRALGEFEEAIKLGSSDEAAWAGAGVAAFEMGDYRTARRYLALARRKDPRDEKARERLDLAELVLANDPYARGLAPAERSARIARAFRQALSRLQACGAKLPAPVPKTAPGGAGAHPPASLQPTEVDSLYAQASSLEPRVARRSFRRDADLQSQAMDLVFQIEETANRLCSPATGLDEALLLIERSHRGS